MCLIQKAKLKAQEPMRRAAACTVPQASAAGWFTQLGEGSSLRLGSKLQREVLPSNCICISTTRILSKCRFQASRSGKAEDSAFLRSFQQMLVCRVQLKVFLKQQTSLLDILTLKDHEGRPIFVFFLKLQMWFCCKARERITSKNISHLFGSVCKGSCRVQY